MFNKTLVLVICGLLILISIGLCTAATPSTMPITVKINASAPYDDDKFKAIVDPAIKGISSTTLTSSARMDLQDIYYQAAAMKVSKDFYPVANNATKFLFYIISYNENMDEYNDDAGLGAFDADTRNGILEQAKADGSEAEAIWTGLRSVYPNSTLYRK
jgi:hypothetical protein